MNLSTSERVRIARERANKTQEAVAREVGLSLHQYKMREARKGKDWRMSELEAAAKYLGVTITDLVG